MKASEYRKNVRGREQTAQLTLPSGAVFKVRRPPLQVWIAAGKVPQSFLRAIIEAQDAGPNADLNFTADETAGALEFVRTAILYAVVEPKLVVGASKSDELDPSELDPEDFAFLTDWIMKGSPGVPVQTKSGGEVQVESLRRFRQKRPGGGAAGNRTDSDEVQSETERFTGVG